MPSVDTLVWILTGALGLVAALGGVIFNMLRNEAKDHAEQIKEKAGEESLTRLEARMQAEINAAKEGTEKLVNKLEARHDREMDALAQRLGEQIRNTENNILTQLRLMVEVVRNAPQQAQ